MIKLIHSFLYIDFIIGRKYKFRLLTDILQSLMMLTIYYFVSKSFGYIEIFDGEYFPYIVLGLGFSRIYNTLSSASVSKLIDNQYLGVLDPIFVSKASTWKILLSMGSTEIIKEFLQIGVLFGLTVVVFDTSLSLSGLYRIDHIFLTVLLCVCFCTSLSLIATSSILLWKRVNVVTMFSTYLITLLGGVYFPIKVLPEWLQNIASIIPFTHMMSLLRYSFGSSVEEVDLSFSYMYLGGLSILLFVFGSLFYTYAIQKQKQTGRLSTL